jgi:hypothetical protein
MTGCLHISTRRFSDLPVRLLQNKNALRQQAFFATRRLSSVAGRAP